VLESVHVYLPILRDTHKIIRVYRSGSQWVFTNPTAYHQSAIFRQPGSHCTAVHVSTSAQAAQEPPSTLGHSTCIGVGSWFMARKSGEVARFLPVSCKIPWNAEVASMPQGFPGKINQREALELTRPNSNGPMVNIPIPIIPTKI
jgi:hypothetical protein